MPDINVSVGKREVAASGSVICGPGTSTVTLNLEDLTFLVVFEEDSTITGPKYLSELGEPRTLKLRLINCNNPLGLAFEIMIGVLRSRQLYLGLFVHVVSTADATLRRLDYCFSLGEQA